MLCVVIIFVAALIATVNPAAFTDLSCTNRDAAATKFLPSATVCSDKFTTKACTQLFGVAVIDEGTVDRDGKCNKDAAALNDDVKRLAIATCPKHCGYCCETPEYNCTNKALPRLNCNTVTQAQCNDPTWRPILAEDCPSVCGFCLTGGCVDKVIECANDPTICRQIDMQTFVKENCQRTCGFCTSTGGTTGTNTTCGDIVTACATWVRNGFCTNPFYTDAQKRQYCGRSCNLC